MSQPEAAPSRSERPPWVWVIAAWYAWTVIATVVSLAVVHSGVIPLNDAQKRFINSMTVFDYSASALVLLLDFVGSVLLVAMRRLAFPILVGGLVLNVSSSGYRLVTSDVFTALGPMAGSVIAGAVFGWLTQLAVVVYVWWLRRRGRLH